jgi:hypothetical protein
MNLREEIISSLQDSKWFIAGGSWDQPADDILEIFEKRIDEHIKKIDSKRCCRLDNKHADIIEEFRDFKEMLS